MDQTGLFCETVLDVLRVSGANLSPGNRVFDLGCGQGELLKAFLDRGLDAWGADFFPNPLGIMRPAGEIGERIRSIGQTPYAIPYNEGEFNVGVSQQVLEHVHDLDLTMRELYRVTASKGVQFHYFPARWRPIESHIRVPFGGAITFYGWFLLWTALGIGLRYPGKSIAQSAKESLRYVREQTHYVSMRRLHKVCKQAGWKVESAERLFLKFARGKAGKLSGLAGRLSPIPFLFRHFFARAIILRRP